VVLPAEGIPPIHAMLIMEQGLIKLLSYIPKKKPPNGLRITLLGYNYDARGAEMKPQYQKTF
jgi:hypothetical protein